MKTNTYKINAKNQVVLLLFNKILFRKTSLVQILFAIVFMISTVNVFGQAVDGNYCPGPGEIGDEYADALSFIPESTGNGTCAINHIWADIDIEAPTPFFKLGLMNGNSGAALFRIYIDSDNDPSTGLLSETGFGSNPFPVAGAEFILQIKTNTGATELFLATSATEYNSILLGNLEGNNGNSNGCSGNDGRFMEFYIPFDAIDYDPCDSQNPGEINIAQYASVAGGSATSSSCGGSTLDFGVELSGSVDEDQTICPGQPLSNLVLTTNGDNTTIDYWEVSTDGIIYTQIPGTMGLSTYNPGILSSGIYYYRAQVTNSGICVNSFASSSAVITVITDTEAPTFNESLPGNLTLECGDSIPTAPTLTANDNCGDAIVTFDESIAPGCGNTETITRTWTASDGINSNIHTQIITVEDTTDPIITCPTNISVNADPGQPNANITIGLPNVSDTCGNVTYSNDYNGAEDASDTYNLGTTTVTYTVTDDCGNTSQCSFTVTVNDEEAPEFNCPPTINVSCIDLVPAAYANYNAFIAAGGSATDNNGINEASFTLVSETSDNNTCPETISRVYRISDTDGNTSDCTQTIIVNDEIDPVLVVPGDETVECDAVPAVGTPSATDNCDTDVTIVYDGETRTDGTCANFYTLTRTWTATDNCDNTHTLSQIITVEDTTPPTIDTDAADSAVECDGAGNSAQLTAWLNSNGGAAASDACGDVAWSNDYSALSNDCGNTGSATVIFTATDECGLTSTTSATFTIQDTTVPFIDATASDSTVECDGAGNTAALNAWLAANGGAVAFDACAGVTWSNDFTALSDDCGNTGSATVIFTATDECGLISTTSATFTIQDTTVPSIDTPASDSIVECDGSGNTAALNAWLAANGGADASDACAGVTWSNDFTALSDDCGNTGSATVIFTATDECGLISTTSATFTIQDTTVPSIDTTASDSTVECDGAGNTTDFDAWLTSNGGAIASDTCSGVTWSNDFTGLSDDCGNTGSTTVIFTATDACGLDSTTSATFTIENTTPPALIGGTNGTAECTGSDPTTNADYLAWRDGFASITTSDTCGDAALSFIEGSWSSDICTDSITVTFIATDACGLTSSQDQSFTISDTTAPELAGGTNGSAESTGIDPSVNADYITWRDGFANIISSDDCGNTTMSLVEGPWQATSCGDSIIVTFTATDECGLTTDQDQIFTISDETPPTLSGGADGVAECTGSDPSDNADYIAWRDGFAGVTGSDISGNATMSYSEGFWNSTGCTDIITVTFTATDECLLTTSQDQIFTISDTTAPSIDTDASDSIVECDGAGNTTELNAWLDSNGGAVASDICADVTWSNDFTTLSDDCGNTGSATVTFTAEDECGLTATTSATFTIIDTTIPDISTVASDQTVQCDGSGNTSEYQSWLDSNAGSIAIDDCSDITWSNEILSIIDECGETSRTLVRFIATDECGNLNSSTALFTILDLIPPTIDTAASDSTVECDGAGNTAEFDAWLASNGGATASDICAGVTWTNDFTGLSDDCGNTGTATVLFTATDDCGNASTTSASFTIEDTTPPTIDTDAANSIVECDGAGNTTEFNAWLASNGGAIASDTCAGVTWTNDFSALSDDCGLTGTASVIFTATDECGLSSTTSATFTIEDTTPPTIDTDAANSTVECDGAGNTTEFDAWLASNGGAIASDLCAGVTWTNDFNALSDDCGATGAASVIFTATDACGNASTTSATFTIEDTTPPTIDTDASNIIAECDGSGNNGQIDAWLAINGGASASDSCSNVTWTNDYGNAASDCSSAVSVTFTATDACGNISTTSATYAIQDTTPPTIDTDAANSTVECDGAGNTAQFDAWLASNGGATATDDCSSINWTNDFTALSDDCGATGTASVIFTATDGCGNASTSSATFTIEDSTPPTIDTDAANSTVECDGAGNTAQFDAWLASNGGATASDICAGVTWTNDFSALSDDCGATGAASVIFTATDACGNASTSSATFTIEDTTPPTIDTDAANSTVECDGAGNTTEFDAWLASNGGATASDSCSSVTWTNDFSALSDDCGATGTASVIFTATDACGNASTSSATFIIEDTTPPTIDTDAANSTVECDGAGNTTEFDAWLASNGGATASEACSGVTWTNDFSALSDDCGATGAASVIFTATDACGNASTSSASFTIEDTTPPTIDTDAANSTVECDGAGNTTDFDAWLASNGGATASDACSGVTWSNDFSALSDDCGLTGTASVIFTATDACGNASTSSASFTIEDTTPPTIDTDAANSTVECDGAGNTTEFDAWLASNGGATASDTCSGVTWTSDFNALSDDCGATGTASVIFTATDACGNTSTSTASFTILDTTPPTINSDASDSTVECDASGNNAEFDAWLASNGGATATDICSGVTWTNDFTALSDDCGNTGSATVIFTATDACGNASTSSATFTITDTTVPELITELQTELTVSCADIPDAPSPGFADNCSADVTVVFDETNSFDGTDNDYEIVRTWTVSDDCNNTAAFTQTLFVTVEEIVTQISDDACYNDGTIDLDTYLSGETGGTWIVEGSVGNVDLNGSIFDPSNLENDLGDYVFSYSIAEDGCISVTEVTLDINDSCIVIPCGSEDVKISKAVTPNGDQWNEFFEITGVEGCNFGLEIKVFNRWGALIYESNNYQNDWNGTAHKSSIGNSDKVPAGTYYYIVILKDSGLDPFTGPIYLGTK